MSLLFAAIAILLVQASQAQEGGDGNATNPVEEWTTTPNPGEWTNSSWSGGLNLVPGKTYAVSDPADSSCWTPNQQFVRFDKEGDKLVARKIRCEYPQLLDLSAISCEASSEYSSSYACGKAFDGNSNCTDDLDWFSKKGDEVVGQWIQLTFPRKVIVTSFVVIQTYKPAQTFAASFDDDRVSPVDVYFDHPGCGSSGFSSTTFPVETKSLKLTVTSAYDGLKLPYIGIKEIQVLGCETS